MTDTALVTMDINDGIAHVRLNRPAKHNAINDALLLELEALFNPLDEAIRVVVLTGSGDNFCAGLDLAEHQAREPFEVVRHSQMWHRVFGKMTNAGIPIVAVLKGAVIGGGLELATTAHVRIAEDSTFFRLPEGRHGIFVGGGASVRVAGVIGAGRMTEMMLTGRTLSADEGERVGLAHYRVAEGEGE
ncbi:MAG TPA: crotonase/enoyl-CoA hydratase family protein, partial [Saccharospirillum sp.]|nr:crotonase/enoyl-CoA hydratase family protein [Saccharospirillum sp.]